MPDHDHDHDTDRGAPAPAPAEGSLARRVHVDLPRVRPEDMVSTQDVEPGRDPLGGRDTETEFMLRYAGVLF